MYLANICSFQSTRIYNQLVPKDECRLWVRDWKAAEAPTITHVGSYSIPFIIMPPPRRGCGGIRRSSASIVRLSVRPSVCLSDDVYIGSNSNTKRPRKTKLCIGVPQVTCDSHADFKVKRSKVKVGRGHNVATT